MLGTVCHSSLKAVAVYGQSGLLLVFTSYFIRMFFFFLERIGAILIKASRWNSSSRPVSCLHTTGSSRLAQPQVNNTHYIYWCKECSYLLNQCFGDFSRDLTQLYFSFHTAASVANGFKLQLMFRYHSVAHDIYCVLYTIHNLFILSG